MEYLPVCLRLRGAPVLLVGGGTVATRKARLLLRAGARLTVVAPEASAELQELLQDAGGEWRADAYAGPADLADQSLVVAATPDAATNRAVSEHAHVAGIPVNVVDSPELCSFIFPAVIDRDPLLIAVSSSGRSPVLARLVRRKIEALIPAAYGGLAEFAGRWRDRVRDALPEEGARRLFWEQAVEGSIGELVLAGRETDAAGRMEQRLADSTDLHRGEVYLLGAGPGDPDLLTFKAVRLLQSADVVLYDRLVAPAIVDMARRDAERIYVGKARAAHAVPQQDINQLLLSLAQAGKRVVRLKGGDPFIFGRGGEEIALLASHGIPFQVVPGITAASGAACYAGIPLTHRDHAQSVRFVAGYLKGDRVEHDWSQFTSETETLVFYMGLVGLPVICRELQAAGRPADTPVALIERGTMEGQRVLTGTLATMDDIVAREKPRAPTLIIVGSVVTLHKDLAWFGARED
ncbi:uroporphyrinogen-III C-methyltransferase [Parahaliea maris]|uniref:Siroheme synthase n=1 Tax=Parahaliea maris TaxID=2716870 RepID=A0A5C9A4P7_9GAMM|nr:siroheme synthase CysG [Parahaliea maris]TXS95768.1 uroporphyrinogen-III C-methyltransferase [Parahaliea maris]